MANKDKAMKKIMDKAEMSEQETPDQKSVESETVTMDGVMENETLDESNSDIEKGKSDGKEPAFAKDVQAAVDSYMSDMKAGGDYLGMLEKLVGDLSDVLSKEQGNQEAPLNMPSPGMMG